ncbi:MAG: phage virion morphogenesis protein [Bacteroidota bacterium]
MGSKNKAKIDSWFKGFDLTIKGIPDIIAETATESFIENFQKESYFDKPWKPLSEQTVKNQKRSEGRILTRTSKLQRSIRPTIMEPGRVRIAAGNSKVKYARVHNNGFSGVQTIKPYTNKNFMGRGKPVKIKGHKRKMKIPRRQYMGRHRLLKKEMRKRIKNYLKK